MGLMYYIMLPHIFWSDFAMFQHFGLVAPTIDVQADRNDVKRSKSLRNPAPEQEWIERPASPKVATVSVSDRFRHISPRFTTLCS